MAIDFQGVDLTAKTFPFEQPESFNASRYSTVPWGQALIDHSFETTAIAAGNTGLISMDIALPSDYVAILRNFHLQIVDTSFVAWTDCVMGFAYQSPGGPYKTTVTDYPEDEYQWYQLVPDALSVPDRFGTNIQYKLWNFGATNGNATPTYDIFEAGWSPTQLPLWIPPSVDSTFLQRTMIIYLDNPNASQPVQQATLRASFDLYTFDQAYSAAVMSSPRVFS